MAHPIPISRTLMRAALAVALVGLAACTDPTRFGGGAGADGAAAGAGAGVGASSSPTSPQFFRETVGDRILFAVDQSTLDEGARATLRSQAEWLQSNGGFSAIIEGHADEQGTREYNLALGARRANSVQEYLVSQGIAPQRLRTVSYGKERPIEICSDESCYRQNRRAVTVLQAGAGS